MSAIRRILDRLRLGKLTAPTAANLQAAYADYRRAWSEAVGNPLPPPGTGATLYGKAGNL